MIPISTKENKYDFIGSQTIAKSYKPLHLLEIRRNVNVEFLK